MNALGGGNEDFRQFLFLALLDLLRRVSSADFHPPITAHALHRPLRTLRNFFRQRPDGGDPNDLTALGGLLQPARDGRQQ